MSKINCDIDESGDSLIIYHDNETNTQEIMVISIDEIFSNLDINRRVVDGQTTINMYAQVTSVELALMAQDIIKYVELKIDQYKDEPCQA